MKKIISFTLILVFSFFSIHAQTKKPIVKKKQLLRLLHHLLKKYQAFA